MTNTPTPASDEERRAAHEARVATEVQQWSALAPTEYDAHAEHLESTLTHLEEEKARIERLVERSLRDA